MLSNDALIVGRRRWVRLAAAVGRHFCGRLWPMWPIVAIVADCGLFVACAIVRAL
jgi:hypothetical protein